MCQKIERFFSLGPAGLYAMAPPGTYTYYVRVATRSLWDSFFGNWMDDDHFDKRFWRKRDPNNAAEDTLGDHVLVVKADKQPADAVEAIVRFPTLWRLDCDLTVQIANLYAIRMVLGAERFNQLVAPKMVLRTRGSTGLRTFAHFGRDGPKEKWRVVTGFDMSNIQPYGEAWPGGPRLPDVQIGLTSKFSIGDFLDLPSLALKLAQPNRPVDIWLAGQLSVSTKTALSNYHGQGSDPTALQAGLMSDLNTIIGVGPPPVPSIYEAQRFPNEVWSFETRKMKWLNEQQPPNSVNAVDRARIKARNTLLLNRLLIEDAYPLELSRRGSVFKYAQGASLEDTTDQLVGRALSGSRVRWTNLETDLSSAFRHENCVKLEYDLYAAAGIGVRLFGVVTDISVTANEFRRDEVDHAMADESQRNSDNIFIDEVEVFDQNPKLPP